MLLDVVDAGAKKANEAAERTLAQMKKQTDLLRRH